VPGVPPQRHVPPDLIASLPAILAYPLRGTALGMLGAIVVLKVFASVLGGMPVIWIFGTLLWLAATLVGAKYVLEVLRDTADGHLQPPQFGKDLGDGVLIGFLAIQLVALAAIVLTALLVGVVPALVVIVAVALVMPAIMMSLAIEELVLPALNPLHWVEIAARLGPWYLLAVGAGVAALLGSTVLELVLAWAMPRWLALPLSAFAGTWAMLVNAHFLGWIVFREHPRLGYAPRVAELAAPGLPRNRDQSLLDAANALIEAGDRPQARALLAAELNERAISTEAHALYRGLLDPVTDRDARLAHARQWLHQLLVEGDLRRALPIALDSLERDPGFLPLLGEDFIQLAVFAERNGQARASKQLRLIALQAFPKDREWPRWALGSAAFIRAHFGDVEQARAWLDQAAARNDDPGLAAEIRAARERLG
jgi:hypothetical protein